MNYRPAPITFSFASSSTRAYASSNAIPSRSIISIARRSISRCASSCARKDAKLELLARERIGNRNWFFMGLLDLALKCGYQRGTPTVQRDATRVDLRVEQGGEVVHETFTCINSTNRGGFLGMSEDAQNALVEISEGF